MNKKKSTRFPPRPAPTYPLPDGELEIGDLVLGAGLFGGLFADQCLFVFISRGLGYENLSLAKLCFCLRSRNGGKGFLACLWYFKFT